MGQLCYNVRPFIEAVNDKVKQLRHLFSGATRGGGDPTMVAMPTY